MHTSSPSVPAPRAGAAAADGLRREADRLESLRTYGLDRWTPEPQLDALVQLGARTCSAPIGLLTVVDAERLLFAARAGLDVEELPQEALGCCPLVARQQQPVVVSDLARDRRFADDPLVRSGQVRAYAGVPLVGRDGLALGALCVVDTVPRPFSDLDVDALHTLAAQAVAQLELRRLDLRLGHRPRGRSAALATPARLRQALDAGELVPHFQPLMSLPDRRVVGFEALLRWHHPTEGVLLPGDFLPVVESSGLVLPVGRAVLDQGLDLLARLPRSVEHPMQPVVTVNVSAVQLAEPGLADYVARAVSSRGLDAQRLSLELTETAVLTDRAVALRELHALREVGVHLSLDDYGTGWANLSSALELPLSTVKLDRSLVQQFTSGPRGARAARAVRGLFSDLGLYLVAEGVETEEQHATLVELGLDYGQGFLYSRALPAEALPAFLAGQRPRQGTWT